MRRALSPQSVAVLSALAHEPDAWRHGYDLGQDIGLKAGSLYPILMRLCDRGLLESAWESDPPVGRPRRHLYRILGAGQRAVEDARPAGSARPARGRRRVARSAG